MALSSSPLVSPATKDPPPSPAPCPLPDPDSARSPAAVAGEDEGPASPSLGCSVSLLPPPPAELPPNFTPVHISDVPVVPTEQAWEEVGGRRRPRLEKAPPLPPRKEAGLSPAFKRRTFGLCFRCLSPEHFVADCKGDVRCLRCRRSGHRERDCPTRQSGRQAPQLRPPSAPAPLDFPAGQAPPCRSVDMPAGQAPPPCRPLPPAPPHQPQRS